MFISTNLKVFFRKGALWLFSSPLPLLFLGGLILFCYYSIFIFSENIFEGKIYTVLHKLLDEYPAAIYSLLRYFWLIFLFTGITIWLVKKQSMDSRIRRIHWIIAIAYFLLFCSLLFIINPLSAQDVFWNLFHGKIFTQYGQNPYLVAPENFSNDPHLSNIIFSRNFKMTHGPIWTLLVSAVVAVFPDNLALQIFFLRIILFIFLAILIYFVVSTVRKLNSTWAFPAFIALAWNPLLLVGTIADVHNDILVGTVIIMGLFLIVKSKYLLGFTALWLSVLVKYIAILLIPLGFVLIIRRHGWKKTVKIGLKATLIFLFLTIIFYSPFGYGQHLFAGLKQQVRILNYETLSPAPFFISTFAFSTFGIGIKEMLGIKDSTLYESISKIVRIFCIVLFAIGYIWLLSRPLKDNQDFIKRGFFIITLFLLLAPNWFMAWYLIWLLPLAIILGLRETIIVFIWSLIVFPYPNMLFYSLAIATVLFFAIFLLIKQVHKKSINFPV